MTRFILISTAFSLTLASSVSAMSGIPNVPSLWPAEGAFGKARQPQDTVTRTQTITQPAPASKATPQDR